MENVNDYIRRYVPREKMQEAYDNCMYTLNLRSVDDSIDNDDSNEQDTLILCREIVGYYYCKLDQAGYFINENDNERHGMEYQFATIDEIIQIWFPIFNEMVQNNEISQSRGDTYGNIMTEYKELIRWPLTRLSNIINHRNNDNYNMKSTYCNLLFRRTSEYISYGIETKSNIWDFISILIKKMDNSNLIDSDLKKLINEYSVSRCVAVAKVIYKNNAEKWKVSFSGFWDNNKICKKFGTNSWEYGFNEIYSNVITRIQFKNINTRNLLWCKLNYNVISYEIKPVKPLPYKLSCFKNQPHRLNYCKKHFSCCERKILANINNLAKIRKIKLYVTYEPCNDCQKAISNITSLYGSNFISVVSKKEYASKGHICSF